MKLKTPVFLLKAGTCLFVLGVSFLVYKQALGYDTKGERISYALSPTGWAEYKDEGIVKSASGDARLITFKTTAAGFSDLEKIYLHPVSLLPLRVERFVRILLKKEYLVEEYSPEQGTLLVSKFSGKRKIKEYNFKAKGPIYNAVTLPFYLRSIPELKVGWSFTASFPLEFKITLVSIEDIAVPAGKFKAYHFTSTPHKFEIWISMDEYRIPVKIKGAGGLGYAMVMKKHIKGVGLGRE